MKRKAIAIITALLLAPLSACGGSASTGAASTASSSATAKCLDVDADAQKTITDGAKSGTLTPVAAKAVKAPARSNAYIVAMKFNDGNGEMTGVWMTSGLTAADVSPLMSVDGYAHQFTNWPNTINGETLNAEEPGVSDAKSCLND
ncbi:MAG: hypothetical protein LKI77_02450 [Bifidobacterium sp.]|jgi:hypothetical protein|nr:hypothetical protein [Bifidobacterium sp.]